MEKYNHLTLNVSTAREATKARLVTLSLRLGCKVGDLCWLAIESLLANPPSTAPVGSTPHTGKAAGFWTVPTTSPDGKLTGIRVVEVQSRAEVTDGRLFFRYKAGEAKERTRALRQAVKAASYDAQIAGVALKDGKVSVKELPQAAPTTAKNVK
jgi:hypothetical protein